MKKFEYSQIWNNHITNKVIYFDDDKVMFSYDVIIFNDKPKHIKIESLYIQPEYRNNGYFNLIMNEILNLGFERIFIEVYKKDWIVKKYRKYGFRRYLKEVKEDEYEWLRLIIKNK